MNIEGFHAWRRKLTPRYGPHYGVAAQGVVRGLGLIYILSFWSFAAQVFGLSGSTGLIPMSFVLELAGEQSHLSAPLEFPTLFWLSTDGWMVLAVLAAGAIGGFCMLYGFFPWIGSLISWACWLSVVQVCQPWLSGTGDLLLLEVGVPVLGLIPVRAKRYPPPEETASRLTALLLLNGILFKVLFMRGWAKLAGGENAWTASTAFYRYFETQLLPSAPAWYLHHLPEAILKNAVWVIVFIETALVFYIFLPRIFRNILAGAVTVEAVLLLLSGQHGFTPLILILLGFALVDDVSWRKLLPDGWGPLPATSLYRPDWKRGAVLICWLPLLALQTVSGANRSLVQPWKSLEAVAGTVHMANRYADPMQVPQQRVELAVQGSVNGRDWIEYRFKLKPTDLRSLPDFSLFHLPRLDEQMVRMSRNVGQGRSVPPPLWLYRLTENLMKNDPATLSLFPVNPFPEQPPRFIRLVLYEYRFADPVTHREKGLWWEREFLGFYGPVFRRVDTQPPSG